MSRFRRAIKALVFGVGPAVVLTATATGVAISAQRSGARNANAEDLASSCSQLTELTLPETTIGIAEVVPRGEFTPPGSSSALDLPSFCRVAAMTEPAVHFEVWLPINDWNGKFQGVGNGGMAGLISYAAMGRALKRGYATASTDTGHKAGDISFDASWALDRPDLIEDYGHRSLHVTTVNAKAVTEAFYGELPRYSYYVGCSKGGQQGLMEAQRYPDDYDGLIAGAPANDWTRFYAGAHLWYSLAMLDDPESYLPPAKLPALGDAVNAACDRNDGVEDGVLEDPRTCDFDPASLICPEGRNDTSCLTPKQAAAVRKIWSGSTNSSGDVIFPGLARGAEADPSGWSRWVTGDRAFQSLHWRAGGGFFRNFVFEDPDWDFRSFDFDKDLEFALDKVGRALDSNDPNLRPLRDRGGKLIVYHGWSDADISPLGAIDYFEKVVAVVGESKLREEALAETQDFFRLFMAPGMGHCRGGPGPDRFDALSALEQWVEHGAAPERIIASKVDDNEVTRTRPLCAYPKMAKWNGNGSTDDAANFTCVAP